MASSPSESATVTGTLGFVALLVGVLVAASYPVVVVTAAAGALTASLVSRAATRVRRVTAPAPRTDSGSGVSTRERDLSRHT